MNATLRYTNNNFTKANFDNWFKNITQDDGLKILQLKFACQETLKETLSWVECVLITPGMVLVFPRAFW